MQVLDGGLFQSEAWKGFQEFLGRRTFTGPHFFGTTEMARFLGKLGYVPRGPRLPAIEIEGDAADSSEHR
jgi:hypothetical protein